MIDDNKTIVRICFKREKQLLSDTAVAHKRNLLVFSTTALFLSMLSYFSGLSEISSILGVSFSKPIHVYIVCFMFIPAIVYELSMFHIHYKKSKLFFTENLRSEPSDCSLNLNFNAESVILEAKTLMDKVFSNHEQMITNNCKLYMDDFTKNHNKKLDLLLRNLDSLDKTLIETNKILEYITSNKDSAINYNRLNMQIETIHNILFSLSNSFALISEFDSISSLYNQSTFLGKIQSCYSLHIYNSEISNLVQKTKSLTASATKLYDEINKKSCTENDLVFTDVMIPLCIAYASLGLTTAFSISQMYIHY